MDTGRSLVGPVAFTASAHWRTSRRIGSIAFVAQGRRLAWTEKIREPDEPERAILHVCDLQSGRPAIEPRQIDDTFELRDATVDGRLCLLIADGSVCLYDTTTWQPATAPLPLAEIEPESWSDFGPRLLAGRRAATNHGDVFDLTTGQPVAEVAIGFPAQNCIEPLLGGQAFVAETKAATGDRRVVARRLYSADGEALSVSMPEMDLVGRIPAPPAAGVGRPRRKRAAAMGSRPRHDIGRHRRSRQHADRRQRAGRSARPQATGSTSWSTASCEWSATATCSTGSPPTTCWPRGAASSPAGASTTSAASCRSRRPNWPPRGKLSISDRTPTDYM